MKQSSWDWLKDEKYGGIVIMDPDGWNRRDLDNSLNELIDRSEFERRLGQSTSLYPGRFFDV